MSSPHRIHHDLYRGAKILKDPGDAGTIYVTKDLQICEMVSGASNETRTLANPTKAGIRFVLRLLTDGGGDVVVTAANGFDVGGDTYATFADASDLLSMISVTHTSGYRWEILEGNVGAAVATSTGTSTATASASSSTTATSTPSSTSTQSISGSDTASGTFSASATATSSTTPSSTSTSSPSSTATATGTP